MNILFVDTLSESGHKNFNIGFVKKFERKSAKINFFLSKDLSITFKVGGGFSNFWLLKKYRFIYSFFQAILLCRAFYYAKKTGSEKVIFLSYEIVSFTIMLNFLKYFLAKNKYYVVEHNTFEPNSKIKSFFFNLIPVNVTHIALSEYIKCEILKFNKSCITLNHPFFDFNLSSEKCNCNECHKLVFMPSSNVDVRVKEQIISYFADKLQYKVYVKGDSCRNFGSIVFKPFFLDYQFLIVNAHFVIIPQKFNFRVSGVFYEAIANSNAKILISNSPFAIAMKNDFPHQVYIVHDWSQLDVFDDFFIDREFGIDDKLLTIAKFNESDLAIINREFYD